MRVVDCLMPKRRVSNIVTTRMVMMPLIEVGRKAGTGFERWQEDKNLFLEMLF